MAKFCVLYSGSSGNSMVVTAGGASILVDAGTSARAILTALQEREIDPATLRGILITHEHSDHVAALRVLLKRLPLPVYASRGTLAELLKKELVPPGADLRELEGPTELAGMGVQAFATPHDAAGPLGFVITTPQGESIGIATDLGHVTPRVDQALSRCSIVVLESNYDEEMLRSGSYPAYLKQRIASGYGHLSNLGCAVQCLRLVENGTARIVLFHLSRENNTPRLAADTVTAFLGQSGCRADRDYRLQVALRSQPSPPILI